VAAGVGEGGLIALAAAVERSSEHPLGAAIVAAAKERGLTLSEAKDFASTTGGGVSAKVDGRTVLVGQLAFLREHSVQGCDPLANEAEPLQKLGQTAIFVAVDGRAAGVLCVTDPIKSTTCEAIDALHQLGLKVIMLTGEPSTDRGSGRGANRH